VSSSTAHRLVLASASPARLETLRSAGLDPEVLVSGVDESQVLADGPADVALELAQRKAHAVAARLDGAALVVGCDSVLELDGEAHGKPASADEAVRRWRSMRGRCGVLHTGHCVVDTAAGRSESATESTTVEFADVSDTEIEAYVGTGEPLLVAGAFTIDGLGGAFVRRLVGDPHNVVGVSLPLLRELLTRLDVAWPDLWRSSSTG
jgi:septum formation protein